MGDLMINYVRRNALPLVQLVAALAVLAGVLALLGWRWALVVDGALTLAATYWYARTAGPPPPARPAGRHEAAEMPEIDSEGFPYSMLSPEAELVGASA